MESLARLLQEYDELLQQQTFKQSDLDYGIFDRHLPFLEQMAAVKNSGITVFDHYKKEHIYASYNLQEIFGYDLQKIEAHDIEYFNERIHPEDFVELVKNGIALVRYGYSLPVEERKNYKAQNEFRILNHEGNYIRVIEQHLILELDKSGNFWLSLSVMDLSPHQDKDEGVTTQMINIKNGTLLSLPADSFEAAEAKTSLTKRETEILAMVKAGYLSKEISDNLSISVHTVNTHRQRILKKLDANNSLEAIEYATQLGLT